MRVAAIDDGNVHAGFAGKFGGTQFRAHAAGAEFSMAIAQLFHLRRKSRDRAQKAAPFAVVV